MTAHPPTDLDTSWQAVNFHLPAIDGRTYTFTDIAGTKGTVLVFICNHCPYVKAVIDRLVSDARLLAEDSIGFAAICPNDAEAYPDDSFANMAAFAARHNLHFPYLHDEDQLVAKAFGAVCTPDYFGFAADGSLRYCGRLDDGRTGEPSPGAPRELSEAMHLIAKTGEGPAEQIPSIGCSIKWKA
ncbi:thioredoxin family protein [Breoghania sp.]|uniref:thioredoxin family protein n=1 Tax=Breoghania sp. TaxID=2065378 RepID=UPI00260A0D4E|nr:thioredoxin family protein [Breoghania sp.]MDJ0933448.1 thioredoxin family protein [Breoghania sp.]